MFPLYFEWFLSYRENVSLLALLAYVLICTYTHVGICLRSAVEDYLNLIELELLTTLGSSVSASQHWADRNSILAFGKSNSGPYAWTVQLFYRLNRLLLRLVLILFSISQPQFLNFLIFSISRS